MKKLALAVALLSTLLSSAAFAETPDFKVGMFQGTWCGYSAVFNIQYQRGDTWEFDGFVSFPDYPEYAGTEDRFHVEQYADNSLKMVRILDGNQGKQIVKTSTPRYDANTDSYVWRKRTSSGVDCVGKSTFFHNQEF